MVHNFIIIIISKLVEHHSKAVYTMCVYFIHAVCLISIECWTRTLEGVGLNPFHISSVFSIIYFSALDVCIFLCLISFSHVQCVHALSLTAGIQNIFHSRVVCTCIII